MSDWSIELMERLADEAEAAIAAAADLGEMERLRVAYLGREGEVTNALKAIGKLPPQQRPAAGKAVNEARRRVETAIADRRGQLEAAAAAERAAAEQLDVTLPGHGVAIGHQHPLMMTMERLLDIFVGMGYQVVTGPEVEWSTLNWTALNYPPDHPAMDEQDSFYINDEIMLRTQTSTVQIRAMRAHHQEHCPVRNLDARFPPSEVLSQCRCTPPPTRVVAPGRTYRRESITLTRYDVFHQLEGLLVDEGISLADLKGTLAMFLREYLGPQTHIRFRPDFFPFTEPSADLSVNCEMCEGRGCRFCKESGWVELGGCGLVHPNVLIAGGYDPEKVSGFAFGFGIERIAQRRFNIEDIRTLYENDVRFLHQF